MFNTPTVIMESAVRASRFALVPNRDHQSYTALCLINICEVSQISTDPFCTNTTDENISTITPQESNNVRSQIMTHHQFMPQFRDCPIKCV